VTQLGITLKNVTKDVTIKIAGAAKVRVLPRPEFDKNGRIKTFKPDRKDPDWKLGGIKGSAKDMRKDVWLITNCSLAQSGKYFAHAILVLGEEETN
jgi:hypothetical protein